MKKYISLSVVLLMVFVFNSAKAEEVSTSSNTEVNTGTRIIPKEKRLEIQNKIKLDLEANKTEREQVKSEMKEKMESVREEAKSKMEMLKAKIGEVKDLKKQELLKKMIDSRVRVFDGFNKVLENIVTTEAKVKVQIEKAKALGIDVSVSESNIVKVDAKLADAKTKIGEAANILSVSTSALTEANKTKLKELAMAIQSDFKEARMTLNETVKSLKESIKNYRATLQVSSETKINN